METKPHPQQRCYWWLIVSGRGRVHFLPWCNPGRSQSHTSEIIGSTQIALDESKRKDKLEWAEKGGLWGGKGILWPKYTVGSSQRTNKNEKIKGELKKGKKSQEWEEGGYRKVAWKTRRRGHGAETRKGWGGEKMGSRIWMEIKENNHKAPNPSIKKDAQVSVSRRRRISLPMKLKHKCLAESGGNTNCKSSHWLHLIWTRLYLR